MDEIHQHKIVRKLVGCEMNTKEKGTKQEESMRLVKRWTVNQNRQIQTSKTNVKMKELLMFPFFYDEMQNYPHF